MRLVPTCAVMDETDAELAQARQQLKERLSLLERHHARGGDEMPQAGAADPWNAQQWRYIASVPWREDDGTIIYLHGFRHARLTVAGEPLAMAIAASQGWWPIGCDQRVPRRSPPRGNLRLVS